MGQPPMPTAKKNLPKSPKKTAKAAATPRRWRCPSCKREFGRRNQSHGCAPSGTVDAFFAERPPVQRKIYDAIARHLERVGPVLVDPVSVCVMFKRTRTFAEVRSKKKALTLSFLSSRAIASSRLAKRIVLSANRTAYFVDLTSVEEFDPEIRGWLTDAFLDSPP